MQFTNAVEAIKHSANRKQQRIGYSTKPRKSTGGTLISVIAGQMLAEAEGTIEFDPYSKQNKDDGFQTIWEYLAWHYPVEPYGHGWRRIRNPDKTQRSRSHVKHRKSLANGFRMFGRFHMEGHGAAWPIYFVPESAKSKLILVITVNPDHKLLGGLNAREVAIARNENQGISGAVSHGKKAARLGQPLPEYLKSLRDSLNSLKNTRVIDLKPRFDFSDPISDPEFQQDLPFDIANEL